MKKIIAGLAGVALAFSVAAIAPDGVTQAWAAKNEMTIRAIQLAKNPGAVVGDEDEQEMGDAVLVESAGKYLLMDTGASYVSKSVVKYLKAVGVKELDIYVSHMHPDHCYGIDAILDNFKVNTVYLPDRSIGREWNNGYSGLSSLYSVVEYSKGAAYKAKRIKYLKKGSTFSFGKVKAKVLGPVGTYSLNQKWKHAGIGQSHGHYLNNYSLTTMLTCGKTTYLTTGDIEEEEETALVREYGSALKADILKMPHHGLDTSNTMAFLNAVKPTWSFAENMGYEDSQQTSTKGQTYKVSKNYQPLQRYHKTGFAYLVGSENASFIVKVSNDKVKLYRDAAGDGKGKRLKGKVRVAGDGLITSGSHTGDYTGKNTYLLDKDSVPQTGVLKVGGKYYLTFPGGCFEQGSAKKVGKKYVFNNYRYYNNKGEKDPKGTRLRSFGKDNSLAVGPTKIDGNWFLFDEEGYRACPSKLAGGSNFGIVHYGSGNYAVTKTGYIYNYKRGGSASLYMSGRSVTVGSNGTVLNARVSTPSGTKAKAAKKGSKTRKVTVKWRRVSGAKGYYVMRATSKNGNYTKVKTVKGASKVKFVDKKVKKGKTYYYKVKAYKKYLGFTIGSAPSSASKVKA